MWDEVEEVSDVNYESKTTTTTATKTTTSSESKSSDTKNNSSEQKQLSEQTIDDIKEKVAESCNETQLTGNDGHIYRGRQQEN